MKRKKAILKTIRKASLIACLFVVLISGELVNNNHSYAQTLKTDSATLPTYFNNDTLSTNEIKNTEEPQKLTETKENKPQFLEASLIIIGTFALLFVLFNLRGTSQ